MKRSSGNEGFIERPAKINCHKVCHDPSTPVDIPYLQTIPVEIFLHICSYLDFSFIHHTLSKVCRRFEDILSDKRLWQKWARRRLRNPYPAPHLDTVEFDWVDAAVELDKEFRIWSSNNTMRHISISYVYVETILLVNNADLCVCGVLATELAIWKISEMSDEAYDKMPIEVCEEAHDLGVSGLAADPYDNSLVHSTSRDGTVKRSTGLTCIETYKCDNAAYSVANNEHVTLAGLTSKVQLFDRRVGQRSIHSYTAHRDAVPILESHDNYVVSASYRTIAVWDKRMRNLLKCDTRLPHCAWPRSLKWENSSIYVGDDTGSLHLLDVTSFDIVASYKLWDESDPRGQDPWATLRPRDQELWDEIRPIGSVTCLTHSCGVIICCSDYGEAKFLFPSDPPEEFNTVQFSSQHITGVQYENNILAISCVAMDPEEFIENCTLEFWIPF